MLRSKFLKLGKRKRVFPDSGDGNPGLTRSGKGYRDKSMEEGKNSGSRGQKISYRVGHFRQKALIQNLCFLIS